jgi:dienelactone hydrolase
MRTSVGGRAAWLLAAALAASAGSAAACGICIEDRVAAVYDQATVDHAVAKRHNVAFFALNGALEESPAVQRAVAAALDAAGVRGTARVSLQSASASVAFDPARASVASVAAAGDRALAKRAIRLEALRVIGEDGRLKEP